VTILNEIDLHLPKGRFPLVREDLRDGLARLLLDDVIGVQKGHAETPGHTAPNNTFARRHEADEIEIGTGGTVGRHTSGGNSEVTNGQRIFRGNKVGSPGRFGQRGEP